MLSVREALFLCRTGGDLSEYSHLELRVVLRDLANLYEQTERCRQNAVKRIDELKHSHELSGMPTAMLYGVSDAAPTIR